MIKQDLKVRSNEYLEDFTNEREFIIPKHSIRMPLSDQEALYRWVEHGMNGTCALSFDKLQRVCEQISTFPDRRTWILNIGKGWSIERIGDVLRLIRCVVSDEDGAGIVHSTTQSHSWSIVSYGDQQSKPNEKEIQIKLKLASIKVQPKAEIEDHLEVLKVEGNEQKVFSPLWRPGRSSIKIKDFLRGQKVPLQKRSSTPIICMKQDDSNKVIAVFIENESNGYDGE